jgi:hypothetical protein
MPHASVEHIGSAGLARDGSDKLHRPVRSNVIPVGARVFHQKFGYGTVTAVENDRLDVTFERAGEKRVLDRYVELA